MQVPELGPELIEYTQPQSKSLLLVVAVMQSPSAGKLQN